MSKLELLNPQNSAVIFIDHQPQMAFGVANIDRQQLKNNTVGLAKAAKIFNVPTIYTSVETESFSGYIWPELLAVHPESKPIERTSMNSWEDPKFVEAVKATGRKKLVMAALWTEVCLNFPTLMAIEAGYEVYIVTDASGGTSVDAHERSIDRMVQAGAIPVTWQQVLLEYQRDWSRKETYDAVMGLIQEHSGAYGMGVDYAYTMVHKAPQRVIK
ncbi:hydrolase [Morganella morganii]|uniref:hydrolase n=1 Tax=Morganella morganii TaxID=582 RepID=UPI000E23D57A|nr:hydrolase [Morganella morganii]REL19863.1 hydrolase [Morganella morganii]HDU8494889.1 hydrolase [Morganella morganii]